MYKPPLLLFTELTDSFHKMGGVCLLRGTGEIYKYYAGAIHSSEKSSSGFRDSKLYKDSSS
jgi:hypothetical protein